MKEESQKRNRTLKEMKMKSDYKRIVNDWCGQRLNEYTVKEYTNSSEFAVKCNNITVMFSIDYLSPRTGMIWTIKYKKGPSEREVASYRIPYGSYDPVMEKAFKRFLTAIKDAKVFSKF